MSFSESIDFSWNSTSDEEGHTVGRNVIVVFVYGSIILVTIGGNLMVIVAFAKDARINRKIANWYIVNLSVADLIVGLISMTVNLIWLITDDWPFGEIPCKIFLFVDYVATNVPVCTIIFISLDRYWLLTKKLDKITYQTKRTATAFITFAWTFCIIFFGILSFVWIPITGYEEEIDYSWNCELEATYNFEFQLFMIILFFICPLLTIAYLNFIVYRNIRLRSKGFVRTKPSSAYRKQDVSESSLSVETLDQDDGVKKTSGKSKPKGLSLISLRVQNRRSTKGRSVDKKRKEFNRHRKAAITLAVLVGVFVFCWLPFYVASLLGTLCEWCVPELSWEVTSNLLWCNSTINPFLYAALNLHFRENFKKFLGLGKWMRKTKDDSMTMATSMTDAD